MNLSAQETDSLLSSTFPPSPALFHHLKLPVFQGRPYYLELFVDIPIDQINSAAIFFRTEKMSRYREAPLEWYRGRYRFKYDPEAYPGKMFKYFFVVTEVNYSIHAIPLDSAGRVAPQILQPVNPLEYFKGL
ncbi:MAG: hypothetical protein ACE5EE_03090 [Fidelibacterota bacterium]